MGKYFNIQGTKFELEGGICLRLWKGDYTKLANDVADYWSIEEIKGYYGGVGGEIGFYNSKSMLK